jgi:hypothetical protein
MFFSNKSLQDRGLIKLIFSRLVSFSILILFLLELTKYNVSQEFVVQLCSVFILYKLSFYVGLASLKFDNYVRKYSKVIR